MAEIVIGIASSHTPQLSSGVEMWHDHAERDRRNPRLLGKDARFHTYEELLVDADPGGLSHFVVDEDLDHLVLDGITRHDSGVLGSLSRERLRSGTSEILNWITAAGALENLPATVIDYVPGYRTPAVRAPEWPSSSGAGRSCDGPGRARMELIATRRTSVSGAIGSPPYY